MLKTAGAKTALIKCSPIQANANGSARKPGISRFRGGGPGVLVDFCRSVASVLSANATLRCVFCGPENVFRPGNARDRCAF